MDARALRLVAITDDLRDGADGLRARAERAVNGGATMIQLRLKDADAAPSWKWRRRSCARSRGCR